MFSGRIDADKRNAAVEGPSLHFLREHMVVIVNPQVGVRLPQLILYDGIPFEGDGANCMFPFKIPALGNDVSEIQFVQDRQDFMMFPR